MKVLILKGGDGAVPWRDGVGAGSSRTPGTVAVSDDGRHWLLVNLSPAVADQLGTDARLLEHAGLTQPGVRRVILTDAQVDHVTGLLGLRDGPPIHLYVTPAVYEELSHSLPVLPLLQHYCGVHWHVIPVAGECTSADFSVDGLPDLEFTAIATQAPLPPHASAHGGRVVGDTIAIAVRDRRSGLRLLCAPGLRGAGAHALAWMQQADCVLIGETLPASLGDIPLYALGEMAAGGEGGVPGEEAIGTPVRRRRRRRLESNEALDVLAGFPARRKVLMRVSTCPDRDEARTARAEHPACSERGIEVAADRMQIDL